MSVIHPSHNTKQAEEDAADVEVEVDEECHSLAALKRALRSALPEEVDLEKVCLEVGGCAMEEEDVVGRLLCVLLPRWVRRVVTPTSLRFVMQQEKVTCISIASAIKD